MDFHNLKRRELQVLCKKHKIPANMTNLEMAEKLTALLTVNEKPLTRGRRSCLKGLDENESDVENRPAKKVRFSPENEKIEFEKSEVRSLETRDRGRRKSVMFMDKGSGGVVSTDNDGVNEEVRELRRSRRGKLSEVSVVESKEGKKATKVDAKDNSIAHEMMNGDVKGIRRSSRGKLSEKREVVCTDNDGVNEEVRELRRSRRGKLSEVSVVESKEGKKAKKVDAKDNSIVHEMVNGDVKGIRRSSRGKLSEKREVESGGKNAKQLNVLEDNCNVDNGEIREVRRSRRGKSSPGSEVEIKEEQRVIKVDALDHNGIVDDVSNGEVRKVRRSRRGKLTEGSDVLKGNLPSAADNVPSLNLQNEEYIAVKKPFLRKRETVDEEMRENEDFKKGSGKGYRVRNLRSRKEEDHEDVAGSKEAVTKSACVYVEAVVRMSKRHVENVQLVNEDTRKNKKVSRGKVAVKECSLGEGGNLRRSQRNASKPESSISVQGSDVITIKNNEKETKNRRTVAVLEGEAARIDGGNPNERSFVQIIHNTKRSRGVVSAVKREKVAKGKGRSKKTSIEVENSFSKDIPTSMADHDTQASSLEASEHNVCNDGNNDKLRANLPDLESPVPVESNFSTERQDFETVSGTFLDSAYSPLTENAVQKQGETFTNVEGNEGNDYKTRTPLTAENDCLALQNDCVDINLEYFNVDKQHGIMSENVSDDGHSASLCKVIEEKAKFESFNGKEREQLDLEEHNSSEPENPLKLNNAVEDPTSDVINDCFTEALQTVLLNAEERKQEELTSTTHSTKTVKLREELTTMQMNSCMPHHVSATATNFNNPELSSFKDSKSDDAGDSNVNSDNMVESREPKSLGAFGRSATRIQLDGDVNCGEDIIYPSDMQGEGLVLTSPSTKSDEIATEFTDSVYVSKKVESLKSNLIMEVDGKPLKDVDLDRHSEISAQSPSELKSGVEADLHEDEHLVESSKDEEIGQLEHLNNGLEHSLESPELNSSARTKFGAMQDKDGRDNGDSVAISDHWDHSLLPHELNSFAKTNFSIIPDRGLPDDGDSTVAYDVPGVVLCLSSEDTEIVVGGEGTEIELSSGRSCSRSSDAEKFSLLLEHQPAGTNTESNHCLLTDDNMPNQGYRDCSEAKVEEESVSMETLFMIKTPTAGEDAGIEKCSMSMDKSLKGVTDILEDQPELIWEGMEKGIYESEAATYVEKHEAYVGSEDEPVNLEKGNSNELKSPHHLIAATEVDFTDKMGGCMSVSVQSPLKNTDESYQDFREDAGVSHERKLSPLPGTNFLKEGAFIETVDSEKHSELRAQLSQQRNGIDEDFLTEIHELYEVGQILQLVAESEGAGNLKDQPGRFDDVLLHDNLNSPARSKHSLIQDQGKSDSNTVEVAESCGVISSPPNVATQIIGGRCTEIELSARKSSSMSSSRRSVFKFQFVGTESKHCLSTDDDAQNQGHEDCFEGGNKEGTDTLRVLSIIETPSTSKDDGLERSDMLTDGRLFGVIEVVNAGLGSMSKGMEPKRSCLSDCQATMERETKETEELEPLNQETCNTIEAKTVSCAIEVATTTIVDGCPSNAAHTVLENSNENGQVETEISFTEPVSNQNPMVEEHTSNQENEMERAMLFCKFDEKSTKEEQEKKVSGNEDPVDVEEDEKWSITHQNICTNAFEEANEDEPKVLFDISITSHENDTVQAPDNGALHSPVSHVASAEGRDCSVLQEPDGALLQLDGQTIDDFKFQGEIFVGKGVVSIDDNHAESGAEIHMLSSEIKIPPSESKEDESFPFDDHIRDAEEVAETSLAMLFETQVDTPRMNPEEMVTNSDSQDPAASEFSISKDQLRFKESEVFDSIIDNADSEPASSTKAPSNTLRSYLSTQLAELAQWIEPEAASVEKSVGAAGKNNPPLNKDLNQGKATDLIKKEAESISGTAEHQRAANASRVAAFERDLIPKLKTDFNRSKNLVGTAAGENFGSAAKYTPNTKNARSILIHGTPNNKLQRAAHLKENEPSSKLEKVGTLTSVKPAKRPAVKPWK